MTNVRATQILLLADEKAKTKVLLAEEKAKAKVLRAVEKAKAKVLRAADLAKQLDEVMGEIMTKLEIEEEVEKEEKINLEADDLSIKKLKKVRRKNPKVKKDESGLYHCLHCDYASPNQNTYCMHVSMNHSAIKPHVCSVCDESFAESTQLRQHNEVKHSIATIPCHDPSCKMLFKTKAFLQSHYTRKHLKLSDLTRDIGPQFKVLECLSCSQPVPKNGCMYHFSRCSPLSPWARC